jgi:hypothetical protein
LPANFAGVALKSSFMLPFIVFLAVAWDVGIGFLIKAVRYFCQHEYTH